MQTHKSTSPNFRQGCSVCCDAGCPFHHSLGTHPHLLRVVLAEVCSLHIDSTSGAHVSDWNFETVESSSDTTLTMAITVAPRPGKEDAVEIHIYQIEKEQSKYKHIKKGRKKRGEREEKEDKERIKGEQRKQRREEEKSKVERKQGNQSRQRKM